jgi:hypothetical protein
VNTSHADECECDACQIRTEAATVAALAVLEGKEMRALEETVLDLLYARPSPEPSEAA